MGALRTILFVASTISVHRNDYCALWLSDTGNASSNGSSAEFRRDEFLVQATPPLLTGQILPPAISSGYIQGVNPSLNSTSSVLWPLVTAHHGSPEPTWPPFSPLNVEFQLSNSQLMVNDLGHKTASIPSAEGHLATDVNLQNPISPSAHFSYPYRRRKTRYGSERELPPFVKMGSFLRRLFHTLWLDYPSLAYDLAIYVSLRSTYFTCCSSWRGAGSLSRPTALSSFDAFGSAALIVLVPMFVLATNLCILSWNLLVYTVFSGWIFGVACTRIAFHMLRTLIRLTSTLGALALIASRRSANVLLRTARSMILPPLRFAIRGVPRRPRSSSKGP